MAVWAGMGGGLGRNGGRAGAGWAAAPRMPTTDARPAHLLQVPDVQAFMAQYNMQCPMAAKRLIYSGLPATVEHGAPRASVGAPNAAVAVAETVQHFITAMDSLKLNMVAVDQIYPVLSDLMQSMNKVQDGVNGVAHGLVGVETGRAARSCPAAQSPHASPTPLQIPSLPADFSGKVKTRAWVSKVHALPASRELGDDDVRQLLFDLESSYNDFMATIGGG